MIEEIISTKSEETPVEKKALKKDALGNDIPENEEADETTEEGGPTEA